MYDWVHRNSEEFLETSINKILKIKRQLLVPIMLYLVLILLLFLVLWLITNALRGVCLGYRQEVHMKYPPFLEHRTMNNANDTRIRHGHPRDEWPKPSEYRDIYHFSSTIYHVFLILSSYFVSKCLTQKCLFFLEDLYVVFAVQTEYLSF